MAKFWFIRIFFFIAFAVLLGNVYHIQVEKGDYYTKKAEAREEASGALLPKRGLIYMTDKHTNPIPVVLNKEYPTIYAVPQEIEDPVTTSAKLSDIVGIPQEKLVKMLSKQKDLYELLVEKGDAVQVEKIKTLNIDGIYIRNETYRYYPSHEMAAHVLGFISSSDDGLIAGRYGLELAYDDTLRGTEGKVVKDVVKQPQQGQNLHLTIDRNIQAEAEKIIKALMQEWNADGASILVQEPKSGKLLALSNLPTFDPNEYSKSPLSSYINDSLQSVYEPGSVFKIITMAAGIDAGKITPDTTYTDVGYVKFGPWTIKNWDHKSHGLQTMTNVIEKSLNTGTIFAQQRMGRETFRSYIQKFGFGQLTNIKLPGEVRGNIRNVETSKEEVDYATASYGQGLSVTPLQMISAASAIANGGVLMRPLIFADEEPEVIRRVISIETSQKIINMMVSAVDKNVLAAVPQYKVAGKTGTAFIPKNGKYTENVINTYIGFAPASDPKVVVLIKLVNPSNAPLAGQTVVPAFKKLTEYLLNYYEIAPDRITQ